MRENAPQNFSDERKFIREHLSEIRPLVSSQDELERVENDDQTLGASELTPILEAFENKLFTEEKQEYAPNAETVLTTMDNPGSWNAVAPLIRALEQDPRCRAISVVTGGLASKRFETDFRDRFATVRDSTKLFLEDLDEVASAHPIDIILASGNVQNGPDSVAFYSGKSVFGAKRVYYICDAWGLAPSFLEAQKKGDTWFRDIDGIFCNDDLAKKIIKATLPEFPEERIFTTGTPVLESLEVDKAEQYRTRGRARFGLAPQTFTLLYLGDVSNAYQESGMDPRVSEKTFEQTLSSFAAFAARESEKQFALMVRRHPRDAGTSYDDILDRVQLPPNVTVHRASHPDTPLQDAVYAADAIASILSTENLLAPLRGKRAVYLGFEGTGLGKDILEHYFSPGAVRALSERPGVAVVSGPTELEKTLQDFSRAKPLPIPHEQVSHSADRILEVLFKHQLQDSRRPTTS